MKQKLLILWSGLWYRFAYLGKGYADAVPVLLPKEERTKILDYNKWQPIDITPVPERRRGNTEEFRARILELRRIDG